MKNKNSVYFIVFCLVSSIVLFPKYDLMLVVNLISTKNQYLYTVILTLSKLFKWAGYFIIFKWTMERGMVFKSEDAVANIYTRTVIGLFNSCALMNIGSRIANGKPDGFVSLNFWILIWFCDFYSYLMQKEGHTLKEKKYKLIQSLFEECCGAEVGFDYEARSVYHIICVGFVNAICALYKIIG